MSTTKMTTKSLALAAVLVLSSACVAVAPSPEGNPTTSDDRVDATPEGSVEPSDAVVVELPQDRYRLDQQCSLPGALVPC